ncbi:MAG: CvpA family protein [Mariprofundaceae bacterium]|nr:CvpA family protein [Mariprofundaceae bacterium]
MNLFDYLLLAITGFSMVLSLWRGFVREIISLIGLVAAFIIAGRASGMAADLVHGWIPNSTAANLAGFGLVFVSVMLVVALIGTLIRKLVDMADLTASDRTLGMIFGLTRGLLLIGLFFLIYTSYAKADKPWLKNSVLTPYAIQLGDLLGRAIPAGYPLSRQGGGKVISGNSIGKSIADIPVPDKKALESIIRKQMQ